MDEKKLPEHSHVLICNDGSVFLPLDADTGIAISYETLRELYLQSEIARRKKAEQPKHERWTNEASKN